MLIDRVCVGETLSPPSACTQTVKACLLRAWTYLNGDDNDLEQLQDQLVGLAALGVIFIARTHEEVLELAADGLLFQVGPDPAAGRRRGKQGLVVMIVVTVVVVFMLAAAVCGAVASRWAFLA